VHVDAAREPAAVEVRHEPGERPEERRLAGTGRPDERDDLAGVELERHVRERGPPRPGIGKTEPIDAD
jgi:hypothetical protein